MSRSVLGTTREPTKHQLRSEATIREILVAAEAVFVREGFEGAQIETIADRAGRTKGAIYAHFSSKEEIFLSLIEQRAFVRREAFIAAGAGQNARQRLLLMRRFFTDSLKDPNWLILILEFKLLVVRHKVDSERVKKLYALIYDETERLVFPDPAGSRRRTKQDTQHAVALLRSIPSALVLESRFSPLSIGEPVLQQVLETVFDALMKPEDNTARVMPRKGEGCSGGSRL